MLSQRCAGQKHSGCAPSQSGLRDVQRLWLRALRCACIRPNATGPTDGRPSVEAMVPEMAISAVSRHAPYRPHSFWKSMPCVATAMHPTPVPARPSPGALRQELRHHLPWHHSNSAAPSGAQNSTRTAGASQPASPPSGRRWLGPSNGRCGVGQPEAARALGARCVPPARDRGHPQALRRAVGGHAATQPGERSPFADVKLPTIRSVDIAQWRERRLKDISAAPVRREMNLIQSVLKACHQD